MTTGEKADDFLRAAGLEREETRGDSAVPFAVEQLDVRGCSLRLDDAIDVILRRHDLPNPVARLLGEAIVLTALTGSSIKFDGRLILQTRTEGPVNLIVVDLQTPNALRGYVRFDQRAVADAAGKGDLSTAYLLGKGMLAMTIDQGSSTDRYQGIVQLDGSGLEQAAYAYFKQSEQIPTLVRLAVAEMQIRGEATAKWRAGGILVQHLPDHGDRTMPDLPGGGDLEHNETDDVSFETANNWVEARSLVKTVDDHELVDPSISHERLLLRLFHEQGVRVFDPVELVEKCGCDADRIEQMLMQFSPDDIAGMVRDGEIEVTCEFCSARYYFSPDMFGMDTG